MKAWVGRSFKVKLAAMAAGCGCWSGWTVDRLELLERLRPTADRDAGQRRLGAVRGHLRLLAQALVEALQQRSRRRRA